MLLLILMTTLFVALATEITVTEYPSVQAFVTIKNGIIQDFLRVAIWLGTASGGFIACR
jgi:hypothetical protein